MARTPDPLSSSPSSSATKRIRTRRVVGAGIAAISTLVILAITLVPSTRSLELDGMGWCVLCGEYGLANILRNVVLFAPLGAGLGMAFERPWNAWLPAVGLTLLVETLQLVVPGRNSLAIDVAANAAGAAVGIAWVRALLSSRMNTLDTGILPHTGILLHISTLLGIGLTLAGTAWAFQLVPPTPPHFVQIQADLEHFDRYEGRVESVRLLDRELQIGRSSEPGVLESRLLGGAPLEVRFVTGPAPRRLAPLFSVYTGEEEELFVLGVHGADLVLRLPLRAARLRLDRPDLRVRGALDGVSEGTPTVARYRMRSVLTEADGSPGACLALRTETCGLRPSLARGWSLLMHPDVLDESARRTLDLLWLLGLGGLAGLAAARRRQQGAALLFLPTAALAAPPVLDSFAGSGPMVALLLAAGVLAGTLVRGPLRRALAPPSGPRDLEA